MAPKQKQNAKKAPSTTAGKKKEAPPKAAPAKEAKTARARAPVPAPAAAAADDIHAFRVEILKRLRHWPAELCTDENYHDIGLSDEELVSQFLGGDVSSSDCADLRDFTDAFLARNWEFVNLFVAHADWDTLQCVRARAEMAGEDIDYGDVAVRKQYPAAFRRGTMTAGPLLLRNDEADARKLAEKRAQLSVKTKKGLIKWRKNVRK